MVFMRTFFRGFLLLIVLASIVLWVVAATLQATILSRDAMKSWIQNSGAYENIVDTIEIRQIDESGVVTSEMLRKAIGIVVTPAFIQKQTEGVVDVVYNWVEGKAPGITYSIPIHEQRSKFIEELGGLIEEKMSALPQCASSMSMAQACIPRAYTLETYALSMAKQTAEDSDLFEEPISSGETEWISTLQQLPMLASLSATAVWLLPIVVVLCSCAYVALSSRWYLGVSNLGKRFVFGSVTLVVIGVLAWIFGGSLDLAARLFGGSDAALIATVVEPILQQAIAAIGMWLTIFAGSIVVVGVILWIVGYLLQRRLSKTLMTTE